MIAQILKTIFMSLGLGFLFEVLNRWLGTTFLYEFLNNNLVTILVALLAINATTMGIVLTKVRELIDKAGDGTDCFKNTKSQMLLSIKEQIALIIISIALLSFKNSAVLSSINDIDIVINSLLIGVFVYALIILYDTAKGVMLIVDY